MKGTDGHVTTSNNNGLIEIVVPQRFHQLMSAEFSLGELPEDDDPTTGMLWAVHAATPDEDGARPVALTNAQVDELYALAARLDTAENVGDPADREAVEQVMAAIERADRARTLLLPRGLPDTVALCQLARAEDGRQPLPVTKDNDHLPDGTVVLGDRFGHPGRWQRAGDWWEPVSLDRGALMVFAISAVGERDIVVHNGNFFHVTEVAEPSYPTALGMVWRGSWWNARQGVWGTPTTWHITPANPHFPQVLSPEDREQRGWTDL